MKHARFTFLLLIVFLISFSCEQNPETEPNKANITFGFTNNVNSKISDTFNPKAILVSVANSDGVLVANLKRMQLYSFSGSYLTNESLELVPGNYAITQLLVVDDADNVTHVLPLEGSLHENLVEDAAPIHFAIGAGENKTQNIQVVKVEGSASEYGYVTFEIDDVSSLPNLVSFTFQSDKAILSAEVRLDNGNTNITQSFQTLSNQQYLAVVNVPNGNWNVEIVARYANEAVSTWYGNPDWWSGNEENLSAFKYRSTISILDSPQTVNAGETMTSNLWKDYFYRRVQPENEVDLYFNKNSWEGFLEVEFHPAVNLKYLYVDKSIHWTAFDGSEHQNQLFETWSICDNGHPFGQCKETFLGKRKFTFNIPKSVKLNDINCHNMFFYYEKIDSQGQSIISIEKIAFCTDLY
ncbi:MAG: hypothetical protein O9340_11385 [Cyclobacteriaceae bacterium]|nr:hypothetical protein [Cyclobacteriaceae bacterium]